MSERFMGWHTIYGAEGDHATPYMTRVWIGRLRLHIFYRGDADPDPHDHPWEFWTFPLTSYMEEVYIAYEARPMDDRRKKKRQYWARQLSVVDAFKWHHRPAGYTHRVLARAKRDKAKQPVLLLGPAGAVAHAVPGKIVTIVWRGKSVRPWGFLKLRDGRWCWQAWREYVYRGGKHAPCEPEE